MMNQNQLREYYNLHAKKFFDPKFEELTENEIRKLKTSIGFKFWKLTKSRQHVTRSVQQSLAK